MMKRGRKEYKHWWTEGRRRDLRFGASRSGNRVGSEDLQYLLPPSLFRFSLFYLRPLSDSWFLTRRKQATALQYPRCSVSQRPVNWRGSITLPVDGDGRSLNAPAALGGVDQLEARNHWSPTLAVCRKTLVCYSSLNVRFASC